MEARGRREVKERRRRRRSGARRGTGGRRRKGKKRERGKEVEKRVSGEKKKGREEKRGGVEAYEYQRRIRRGTRGRMVRMRANDRRVMYRGRERSGLSMYVLAARRRGSAYSTEAGVKYYVVGVVGSGRRLYGRTRRYGGVGTRNRLERKRREGGEGRKRKRGRRRVSGARRRKRGAVPRHRWVADVYEGAPSGAGRYFAVVPKRARRVRRVRRGGGRERRGEEGRKGRGEKEGRKKRLERVGGRTMVVGGRGAVRQRRWKRRRAYSGVRNVGQRRRGVRVGTVEGVKGRRRYRRVYRRMTGMGWVRRRGRKVNGRERKYRAERKGLGKENGVRGGTRRRRGMSMAGVPPMGGFRGKRRVYREVVEEGYRRRARRGVRTGLVGAFNYLRRAKRSRYEEEGKEKERGGRRRRGKKEEEKREVERTKEETRGRGRGRGRRRRRRRNPRGRLERGTKRGRGRRR